MKCKKIVGKDSTVSAVLYQKEVPLQGDGGTSYQVMCLFFPPEGLPLPLRDKE